MRVSIILSGMFILLVFMVACTRTPPEPAPNPDYLAMVKAYERAHNAYEVEAVMGMFAEDAQMEVMGLGVLPNLEAIRAIHEYDIGIHAQLTFQNCSVDGMTVTCEVQERNDWLDAAGLEDIYYPSAVYTFTPQGRIQKIVSTMSDDSGAALGGTMAEFIPWLMAERPDESAPLFGPEGQFIYSEGNGRLVVGLLQEWQTEK